jgi:hypothetical protein
VDVAVGFEINPVIDGFLIPVTDALAVAPGPAVTQYAQQDGQDDEPAQYGYKDHHFTSGRMTADIPAPFHYRPSGVPGALA